MDLRLTFNEDAANYDRWRPGYSDELFADIFEYAKLQRGDQALEIGIGTGQATEPFLRAGLDVTAVELGADLAGYVQGKFAEYPNLRVHNGSFEDYVCEEGSIGVLYSATAFHWIPDDVGYPKAHRLLKTGGTLALFWNRPSCVSEHDPVHIGIQQMYRKYRPGSNPPTPQEETARREHIASMISQCGFRDVQVKLYHRERRFGAEEYICLLNTYSDHRATAADVKSAFEREVADVIRTHGNVMRLHDTMDLYLARK